MPVNILITNEDAEGEIVRVKRFAAKAKEPHHQTDIQPFNASGFDLQDDETIVLEYVKPE